MVAKTHTDDPFWKFRDQPQEKVAISACCWPRNPSDIAERLYRRRRTATLLFILLFNFTIKYALYLYFLLALAIFIAIEADFRYNKQQ